MWNNNSGPWSMPQPQPVQYLPPSFYPPPGMPEPTTDTPQETYAPPPGPPPSTQSNDYLPPAVPPPSQASYAPPPGPPPNANGAEQHVDGDRSLFGRVPGMSSITNRIPPSVSGYFPPVPSSHFTPSPGPPRPPPQNSGYPGQAYHASHASPSPHAPRPPPGPQYAPPPMPPMQMQHVATPNGHQTNLQYQYSNCTGTRKALLIGINYIGQKNMLRGCINDARRVSEFLTRHYHYKRGDIVMLVDDAPNPRQHPTRKNIIDAMRWLVRGAKPNDSLFFHFSGHGGQTRDLDGDEEDGFDEVIYPVDHKKAGHIVDDEMHDLMVKPLPPGCRLTSIFDCCHSGSILDLPYMYSTEGKLKEPDSLKAAGTNVLGAFNAYGRGDLLGVVSGVGGLLNTALGGHQEATNRARQVKWSPADVISFSGCKDSQTSADAYEGGMATGAMSYAFIRTMEAQPKQSYYQLLNNIRDILREKYSQKPQLASSHPLDTNLLFIA